MSDLVPNPAIRYTTIGLSALVVAVLIAFALSWGPIDLPFQHVTATMQVTTTVEGHVVRLDGVTNLPDGALIDFYYWHEIDDENGNPSPGGVAEVVAGKFSSETDLSEFPSGHVTAEVSFSTMWGPSQPQNVLDLVGGEGEHLAGPQVYVDSPGDPKQLFVTSQFTYAG